jgi:hypothetical protein
MTNMVGSNDCKSSSHESLSNMSVSAFMFGVTVKNKNKCSRSYIGTPEPNMQISAMTGNLKLFKTGHLVTSFGGRYP